MSMDDNVIEAARRLLARAILPTGTNLNMDTITVARAVLASGERESRLEAAIYGALDAIDRNVYNCFHDLEGNRLDVPHCDSFCEQFGHHTLLELAEPLREALAASGTASTTTTI